MGCLVRQRGEAEAKSGDGGRQSGNGRSRLWVESQATQLLAVSGLAARTVAGRAEPGDSKAWRPVIRQVTI